MSRIIIRQVPAFETADGQKVFSAEEARHISRGLLYAAEIESAIKANPQFARLDKELLIAFCRAHGVRIGEMSRDPLEIAPLPGEPYDLAQKRMHVDPKTPPMPAARPIAEVARPVRSEPVLGMPYGQQKPDILKTAIHNVDAKERALSEAMERELDLA